MTSIRRSLGQLGEQLAADHLAARGYEIVTRNYRCPSGEIDLVTRLRDRWVFVEVRTRRGNDFGTPEESVTAKKKQHVMAAAQTYLQAHAAPDADWRIDFVGVELSYKGELLRVEVIENAINDQ
ncbi:MAG: YraN family protein [Chloroflexi bacterium]|nr:YraN family protein [Chloroflexota bacterium]